MHTFTWLMIHFILNLIHVLFFLTQLELICISHFLQVFFRVLTLIMHLVLVSWDQISVCISLACLRLWSFPYLPTLNHLTTFELNIGLCSKSSLLFLHFLDNLGLLLLLFNSLIVTPLSLGTCILHFRFFLFVFIIWFCRRFLNWFFLLWRFLSWLRTSIRAFFHFLGWLFLNLYFLNSFFLLYFL